jgi:hypothetical protein
LIKLKKILDNLLRETAITKDDNFIFFGNKMAYSMFYLAKEFPQAGNVYIKCFGEDYGREFGIYKRRRGHYFNYLDVIILRWLLKIVLQLDLVLYDLGWKVTWGIDEHFLQRHHIEELPINKSFRELQLDVMDNTKIIEEEYDHIIVGQYPGALLWVTYDSLEEMYKQLLGLETEFILKMHPAVRETAHSEGPFDKYFNCWEKLPAHIPVELVFRNIRKTVLSISSDALIIASRLKYLKSISLCELVEWKDTAWKQWLKNFLTEKSENRILFPGSFAELRELINDNSPRNTSILEVVDNG